MRAERSRGKGNLPGVIQPRGVKTGVGGVAGGRGMLLKAPGRLAPWLWKQKELFSNPACVPWGDLLCLSVLQLLRH